MPKADSTEWIHAGLAVWSAYDPAVKCDLCSTAVLTGEGLVFIDPIDIAEPALAKLAAAAPPLAILLTNGNHARSASTLRDRLGVRVVAPSAAAEALEIEADVLFAPGELALAGIEAIALPSAGPGEVAYRCGDTMVMGDALIHLDSTGFAMLPAKYCVNPATLPAELRKLLTSLFKTMTFAHGAPLTDNPRRLLQDLLA